MADCDLSHLPRKFFKVVEIDPPWRFAAGTKSRPQHYPRMTLDEIMAMPIKSLLHPDGARVMLWITAPLLNRLGDITRAWGLRYSSTIPWIKLWPSEIGMFVYAGSVARGHGFEVVGNAEYVAILKYRTPQSIKGRPFPGAFITPRRAHSRKPAELKDEIEKRLEGPYLDLFSRASRTGWMSAGNETGKFDIAAE